MNEPDIKCEDGRLWRRGSTEGIAKWVSTDPTRYPIQRPLPRLKPMVMAVRLTLMR